jgi:predicted nucleotidyltransferase
MNGILGRLLGSNLRAKVLGWLFTHPDERYFVRQLTSLVAGDSTNISRELARLEKTGILVSTTEGKQKYYQANRQSPLFNELHGLIIKTVGVADVLRSALAPFIGQIKVAFIFGSIASGDERTRSDIDVMIVGRISFEDVVSLLSPAEQKLRREINPVVYPITELKRKVREDHHFVKTVLEGEKIFLIGNEDELAKLVSKETSLVSQPFRLPHNRLAAFCRKRHIRKLSLFGSVLTKDFRPDSDIDVLVEFEPGHVPGFGIIDMENELSRLVGRKVDLRTAGDLSRYFRDEVVREAKVEYAETQS